MNANPSDTVPPNVGEAPPWNVLRFRRRSDTVLPKVNEPSLPNVVPFGPTKTPGPV